MNLDNVIIIGAGISGLGASYSLRQHGIPNLILEKDETYGGLCSNFTIAGDFMFDRFVHLSFSKDNTVNEIFRESCPEIYRHIPNPYNLYKGKWIKHPAQNNLFPLSEEEKADIIADFKKRPTDIDTDTVADYEHWLRIQYGNRFAELFPMQYTSKYWMCDAKELETKWVGNRLYQPSLEEVIKGSESSDTPVTYYAKEMRYPKKGSYKRFLKGLADNADIRYGQNVVEIDTCNKKVRTKEGEVFKYSRLVSSMPLPLLVRALGSNVPSEVVTASQKLKCTFGYLISIALKGKNIPPYLWWYIYDIDILPARVYSPSLKSPDNVPEGCSSLQLEVYCRKDEYSRKELIEKSVEPLVRLGIIRREDIIETDIRFEPWANVIFDHNIYDSRKTVLDHVRSVGIEPIGRFGLWDYLWSDQALLTGLYIDNK